ncbi:phage terminase large subunit [Gammaproteobacteria bacterium]
MPIELPYNIRLRDYQKEIFSKFFIEGYRRFCCEWHRRSGKDKTFFNLMIAAAMQKKGVYYYMFPEIKQAKAVIWEGIDKNGLRFLDHITRELLASLPNNSDLKITLINGSVIKLTGADRFDSRMGTSATGMVFSEFSLISSRAWSYFSPILRENTGWAAFLFTPRGLRNHASIFFDTNRNNPEWFCNTLTIEDTGVFTKEEVEKEKLQGIPEEMIRQEYYCDRLASLPGAYFAQEITKAEKEQRISDFHINKTLAVHTFGDLGIRDSTSIWLIQHNPINQGYEIIAYYENRGEKIEHYINWLHDFRDKERIVYGRHFAPHDIDNRDLNTGASIKENSYSLGIKFETVKRISNKALAINAARTVFDRIKFHKTNCQYGLECLKNYHAKFNDAMNVYGDTPVHNWASHGTDAFMTFALSYEQLYQPQGEILYNRVKMKSPLHL